MSIKYIFKHSLKETRLIRLFLFESLPAAQLWVLFAFAQQKLVRRIESFIWSAGNIDSVFYVKVQHEIMSFTQVEEYLNDYYSIQALYQNF